MERGKVVDGDERAVGAPRAVSDLLLLHHPGLRDYQAMESARPLQGQSAVVTH